MLVGSDPTRTAPVSLLFSASQQYDFFEKGFVLVPQLFGFDEIQKIKGAFNRLEKQARTVSTTTLMHGAKFVVQGERIDRVVWCGGAEPYLLDLSADPRLLGPATQLLGSPTTEQLICQAHFKLPGDGVAYDWHQDSEKRRYGTPEWSDVNGKGSFVQTIMAIDECANDNGPLLVWPESCKWGHVYLDRPGHNRPAIDESKFQTILMEPGSVLFLHPFTIHGSRSNESTRPRRVFVNGYAYPGANRRVYPGSQACRKLTSR